MITPGQASRIACWISLLTLTSQDGRCPWFGACWRRWICITLAPASNAALASRAICSGVTGTWCCFGSVSTPFSAQVMTALSLMRCIPNARCAAVCIMAVGSVRLLALTGYAGCFAAQHNGSASLSVNQPPDDHAERAEQKRGAREELNPKSGSALLDGPLIAQHVEDAAGNPDQAQRGCDPIAD